MIENTTQEHALVLLVREIMDQIDEIAALRARGHAARISMRLLHEMTGVLRELSPQLQARYYEIVLTLLPNSNAPRRLQVSEDYERDVAPAKEQFVERIRNNLLKKKVG